MSRLLVAQRALTVPGWAKDALWRRAQAIPSLDLRFADSKSLVDATTGANLVTFTRASSATFVDSTGVLRSATTNLLLRSEEFNNASWNKAGLRAFGSGSVANAIAAPNGSVTADFLVEDTSTGEHFTNQNFTAVSGTSYTFSVFIKPSANKTSVMMRYTSAVFGGITNQIQVVFATGAVTVLAGTPTGTATPLPNGWWRISITGAATANGSPAARIQFYQNNGTSISYTGDGTSGYYLWGAQLEQSATVGEYIPTTSTINSAPRFDHNPITGESLGLLVEEQRSNLLLQSEDFSTTWIRTLITGFGSGSEVDVETAPDGTLTADLISIVSGSNSGTGFIGQTITKSATATTYTVTVFAKAQNWNVVRLQVNDAATNNNRATVAFSLATGAITIAAAAFGTFSAASAAPARSFVNGWFRVNLTFTSSTETGLLVRVFPDNSSTVTADGTSGIYIWGAQLEAGAFPTSYIPTTTAAVTRNADVASITGTAFSSWYRQDEGTVFADGAQNFVTGANVGFVSINDASNSNRFEIRQTRLNPTLTSSGTNTTAFVNASPAPGSGLPNVFYKQAVAFGGSSHANYVFNGLQTSTTTLSSINANRLILGARDGQAAPTGGASLTVSRLAFWPQRLANSTLQQITQ